MVILINAAGLLLIGFIIWWFWLYKTTNEQVAHGSIITIEVADGYIRQILSVAKRVSYYNCVFCEKIPRPVPQLYCFLTSILVVNYP